MARQLRCSECKEPLTHPQAKTCSAKCRSARSRRIKAQRKAPKNQLPEHLGVLSDVVRGETKDTAREVLKEEMRPVVREAITSDVLRAVDDLVALTPRMVDLIREDMESEDPSIRQKAYTLLAKYTLGNPSVAPASAEAQPAPLSVVFQLPRPGDDSAGTHEAQPAEAVEMKDCQECGKPAPADEFPDNAERCQACHDALRQRVLERFGAD